MRLVKRGAEAKVYLSKLFGKDILVKRREKKEYRINELDESLRRGRTRNETRIMLRASEAGVPVPKVFYVDDFDIWMELLPGDLLREKKVGRDTYSRVGRMLADLHLAGITHGDFTPANVMVGKGGIWFIDFGLSSFTSDTEEQAIDLLLMQKSIGLVFDAFLEGYKKNPNWKNVLERAAEIMKRGRYQLRAA